MRILNLYCGIGGNRKLWGKEHEITAVENDPDIAKMYQDLYPNDTVIVGDAHEYLQQHYKGFDFIWSSPPCPTHSRMNFLLKEKGTEMRYPDMKLYEEILFLKHFFKGKWVVENVRSYYEPLIKPLEIQSHYWWSNFHITDTGENRKKVRNDKGQTLQVKMEQQGIFIKDFYNYKRDKRTLLNNCVEPELGLHILQASLLTNANPQA
jgi:DNA (cytosine-5)-methyltransferase 1